MPNKKSVMAFSAVQILVFHLWICTGNSSVEEFIKQTAYIGVDIFFLLSAFSLAAHEPVRYFEFVRLKFKTVYAKFVIFSIIAAVYFNWNIRHFIATVLGVEFLTRGGGSFLWFIPAIMICYLIYPIFRKCDDKNGAATLAAVIYIWLFGAVVLLPDWPEIAILWNRLPIFFIGHYLKFPRSKGIVLCTIGTILLYKYGFAYKLQYPIVDMFYVVAIPIAIGLTTIVSKIQENRVISEIGSSTLEMYAVQMIFGYNFANMLMTFIDNYILVNIYTMMFVIITSIIFSHILRRNLFDSKTNT